LKRVNSLVDHYLMGCTWRVDPEFLPAVRMRWLHVV
jgi:hypothetical protein